MGLGSGFVGILITCVEFVVDFSWWDLVLVYISLDLAC